MSEGFVGDLIADSIALRGSRCMEPFTGSFVKALKQYNARRDNMATINSDEFFVQLRERWKQEGIASRDTSHEASLRELEAIRATKLVLHCESCGAPENAGQKCAYCGSKYST